MTNEERWRVFDRGVDLVIEQNLHIRYWSSRFIAIQAGLAVAAGAVINWRSSSTEPFVLPAVLLLSAVAWCSSIAVVLILLRNLAWQAAYVGSVKGVESAWLNGADAPRLFRDGVVVEGCRLATVYKLMGAAALLLWAVFAIYCAYALPMYAPAEPSPRGAAVGAAAPGPTN